MQFFLLLSLLFTSSLFALPPIDRSASTFQMRKVNQRVDRFDFSGAFPNLENIDIDARKNKCVEFDLSGEYPLLTSVNYEGSFGSLKGALTGKYPILSTVNILCTSCAMQLDLTGEWERSCRITIRGVKEDIALTLPEGIGLIIHTKTSPSGKVIAKEGLKKKGWLKILKKTYHNALAETAPIVLTLDIETTDGKIILN
ncbi:MAG: hypothetical protein JJU12_05720 [Chlamydiales bacterium]|nr:hypothetical protein [Chlamydiales bacterium]